MTVVRFAWLATIVLITLIFSACQPSAKGVCVCGVSRFDGSVCAYTAGAITNGLVLEVDAAKGNGSSFPGTGCSATSWVNLANSSNNGVLSFSNCGSILGWFGEGTAKDPYRLAFGGTSGSYVSFATNPLTGSGSFTVEVWFKTSSVGIDQTMVSFGNPSTNNEGGYFRVSTGNKLNFDLSGVGGPNSSANVNDGVWHHGVVVNTAGSVQLYIDGSANGSAAAMTPSLVQGNGVRISYAINNGASFPGSIARVAMYNRALSSGEVRSNYDATSVYFNSTPCN